MKQFITANLMETLMEQRIEAKLDTIEANIKLLDSKVDNLQFINIKNGGGRHVTFRRDEFFQMLYDRPRAAFLGAASFSEKAMKIIRFLGWIVVAGYILHDLFKVG